MENQPQQTTNVNINLTQPALVANTKKINAVTYFIVTWFLGWLGVHRFMRGETGMGVLYLLTGGLFFVGAAIDWIFAIIYLIEKDAEDNIHFVNGKYAKVQK